MTSDVPRSSEAERLVLHVSRWLDSTTLSGDIHVVVRVPADIRGAALFLAAVVRVFDASSRTTVHVAVAGVAEARESDARTLIDLLSDLSDDPRSLPDIELAGDGEADPGASAVFEVTGRPSADAHALERLFANS